MTDAPNSHVRDMRAVAPWWRDGVLYQIYPRSFRDSDADGVGDLRGIIDGLDYLQWLGVEGVWLSPIYRSPMADYGYDVSDHVDVDPIFGSVDDVDLLVTEAHRRGIGVLFDFVPNHTSIEHRWFQRSRRSRDDEHRDWYWWRDPKADGSPPNNWLSHFAGPAWTLDDATGQYYLHLFLPEQPDLNWANPEVVAAMHDVLRFWLRRGVDGFRIDVVHALAKDARLRDDPPHPQLDALVATLGEAAPRHLRVYSENRPEVHDLIRGIRSVLDEFGAIAVGEVYLLDIAELVRYLGPGDDQLHLAFNFPFLRSAWNAPAMRAVVERTEALFGRIAAWPTWTLSNHDHPRHASRYGAEAVKAAAMLVLSLRGTPFLYYGEELGMPDVNEAAGHDVMGRDPSRAPMRWDRSRRGGFTTAEPWLPLSPPSYNVADQAADPDSVLSFYRRLIAVRRREDALRVGSYEARPAPDDVFAWRRGDEIDVAVNMGGEPLDVGLEGTVIVATERHREGEVVGGRGTTLAPCEGIIVRR